MNIPNNNREFVEIGTKLNDVASQSSFNDDVLICGKCTFQSSDLNLFIQHKQECKKIPNPISSSSLQAERVIMPGMQNTFVNFSLVVPHVIVPNTPNVVPKILLEPTPASNLTELLPTEGHSDLKSPSKDILTLRADSNKLQLDIPTTSEEVATIKEHNLENDTPMISLANLEVWDKGYHSLDDRTLLSKSATHSEEEDVATFLANQMVAQKSSESLRDDNRTLQSDAHSDDNYKLVNEAPVKLEEEKKTLPTPRKKRSSQRDSFFSKICHTDQGVLYCLIDGCDFKTIHKKNITRHYYSTHTDETPFQCSFCDAKYQRKDKLTVHLRTHTGEKPHKCTVEGCTYRSIEKSGLVKHLRTHSNERPYACQNCDYRAKEYSQLQVHLRSHTGDTPFDCPEQNCNAAFATSSDLKRHSLVHSGLKPHPCPYCGYSASLKNNLKTHMRLNHYDGPKYTCTECNFSGTTRKQFKEHQRTHKEGKRSNGRKIILRNGKARRNIKYNPELMYVCETCGKQFVRPDSYRSHMRQHAKQLHVKDDVTSTQNEETPASNEENEVLPIIEEEIPMEKCHVESGPLKSYVITIDGVSYPFEKHF